MESQLNYLEEYLVNLEVALAGMEESKRRQAIVETRSHLQWMVAARQSEGLSEIVAWQQARAAFGEPRAIGKALLKAEGHTSRGITGSSQTEMVSKGYLCIIWLVAAYCGLQSLASVAASPLFISAATLAWLPALWAFQNWCNRQHTIVTQTTQVRSTTLSASVFLCLGLKLWFDAQPYGSGIGIASNLAFGTIVLLACGSLLPWGRSSQGPAGPSTSI